MIKLILILQGKGFIKNLLFTLICLMWHDKNKSHLPGIIVFGSLFSSLLQVLFVTLVTAMIAYPNPYTRYFFFYHWKPADSQVVRVYRQWQLGPRCSKGSQHFRVNNKQGLNFADLKHPNHAISKRKYQSGWKPKDQNVIKIFLGLWVKCFQKFLFILD